MKKLIFALTALFSLSVSGADTKWFEEARLGMFVHFGPYSVLANGEWIMNTRPILRSDYLELQDIFNPEAFSAEQWVSAAKGAGMKYIIVTSRHHDSFSNWDTAQSDWNIMNTPYGKDILRQLADECRKQGIKLGFYYSLLDWTRDDYQWRTGRTGQHSGRTAPSNWDSYIDFMKAQLTELLTNYGDVAVIWFDGHWDQTADKNRTDLTTAVDWHYPEIYSLIHSLQPNCLVANNHHLPPLPEESYQIFERDVPGENTAGHSGQAISPLPLETCNTIGKSWSWSITDQYKSVKELVHMTVRTSGMGANLLLNVGPKPNGLIDSVQLARLEGLGAWMKEYGYTIYGTQAGFIKPQPWGAVTRKGNIYYVHILDPSAGAVELDIPKFRGARLLTGSGELGVARKKDHVTLTFPETPDEIDTIIEIKVK